MGTTPTQDPAIQSTITDIKQDIDPLVKAIKEKNVSEILQLGGVDGSAIIKLLPGVVGEVKAGYKTTEFYGVVVAALNAALANGESKESKIVVAALAGAYAIARTAAKFVATLKAA
jgi:hypothetical protein